MRHAICVCYPRLRMCLHYLWILLYIWNKCMFWEEAAKAGSQSCWVNTGRQGNLHNPSPWKRVIQCWVCVCVCRCVCVCVKHAVPGDPPEPKTKQPNLCSNTDMVVYHFVFLSASCVHDWGAGAKKKNSNKHQLHVVGHQSVESRDAFIVKQLQQLLRFK